MIYFAVGSCSVHRSNYLSRSLLTGVRMVTFCSLSSTKLFLPWLPAHNLALDYWQQVHPSA